MNSSEPNSESSLFQLNLDAANSYALRSAASWAKVLGVVGMVLGAIFVVLSIIALSQFSGYGYSSGGGISDVFGRPAAGGRFMLILFLMTGGIFITGGIFSYVFGNRINKALSLNDQQVLNSGFNALRNYYALRSIVLIIVLLLFVVSFASAI